MATDGPVSRWNGITYSGDDERLLHAVLLMPSGAGRFSARSGRRPGAAAPTVSGLVVTMPADAGVIYDESLGGGPWLWALPSPKPVTLDARPGAGTSRIDLIVARIYNVAGGRRELAVEVVTGQAGATPSKPALPALSMELAAVTVPASGNLTVLSNPARTVAAGGILPVATTAARDALPAPYVGLAVYNEQTGQVEVFDGARFNSAAGPQPYRLLTRTTDVSVSSGTNAPLGGGINPIPGDQGNASGITLSGGTLTVGRDGLYWVMIRYVVPPLSSGTWTVGLYRNGVDPIATATNNPNMYDQEARGSNLSYMAHLPLAAGDTLQQFLRQVSGSTQTVAKESPSRWEVRRVGAA